MQLPVARMGHPILRQRASEVTDLKDPKIQKFIADMQETFLILDGVGLAAPQVFQPLRIIIFRVEEERAQARGYTEGVPLTILINPVIEPLSDEKVLGWEACFSLPDLAGLVPRYQSIRYRGLSPEGELIEREAHEYHARVVQHEYDHLDGIMYPSRMPDITRFGFIEEIREVLSAEKQ